MPRVSLNTPAPDFTLTDTAGNSFHLSTFKGEHPVLLVFNRTFS